MVEGGLLPSLSSLLPMLILWPPSPILLGLFLVWQSCGDGQVAALLSLAGSLAQRPVLQHPVSKASGVGGAGHTSCSWAHHGCPGDASLLSKVGIF